MPTLQGSLKMLKPLALGELRDRCATASRPSRKRSGPTRGSGASALWLLLGTTLALLLPAPALAASAEAQIQRAIAQHLGNTLRQEAERHGWQGLQFSHASQLPAQVSELPPCSAPLQLHAGTAPLLQRQHFELRCPKENGWKLAVSTQVQVSVSAVHAASVIERGQTIGAADLSLQPLQLSQARRGFYSQPEDIIGLVAKRRIRPKQLLIPSLLDEPLAVQRGQPVKIIASQAGIAASTMGEALSAGRIGDLIRVRNASSDKVIDAKVVEPGVVSSLF